MKNGMRTLSFALISVLLSVAPANAFWSSTDPELVNLTELYGELQPGQSYQGSFYFSFGGHDQPVELSLALLEPLETAMWRNGEDVSEDTSHNIAFNENPVMIPLEQTEGTSRYSNQPIKYNKELIFTLEIPIDAEPGWHTGALRMTPTIASASGPNAKLFSFPRPTFVYKVAGEVIRDLSIEDITVQRLSDREVNFIVTVRNDGTVTTKINKKESPLKLYTATNEIRFEDALDSIAIKPHASALTTITWKSSEPIQDGEYRLVGDLSYTTNEEQYSRSVIIPAQLDVGPTATQLPVDQEKKVESTTSECKIHVFYLVAIPVLLALIMKLFLSPTRRKLVLAFIASLLIVFVLDILIC